MASFVCLALFAALSALVLQSAHGAPAGAGARAPRQLDYETGRHLSRQLNTGARYLYTQVEIPEKLAAVSNPPLMIRPEDKCDPISLQKNAEPCLSRVALALKNYSRIFGEGGIFKAEKCSKWKANTTAVAELTTKLLHALKEPVESPEPLIVENWSASFLCRDSVERLYSFSIITARIFNYLSLLT